MSIPTNYETSISIINVNDIHDDFDLDEMIRQDVNSLGFYNNHINDLAEFSLGDPSDIEEHWSNY